jgi:diguanylate cyclase (GGDEF)-like protein
MRTERRHRKRRTRERWAARLRPVYYGLLIDVLVIIVLLIAERRTRAGLAVLGKRMRGETEARFAKPRFLGTGNLSEFESLAGELEDLRKMASTDVVTGLGNPAQAQADLLAYAQIAQSEGTSLAICVVDVDHFKDVNEIYGHEAGNVALRQLAARLREAVPGVCRLSRWGGDEFLALIPGADLATALAIAQQARGSIAAAPFEIAEGVAATITVTIGVAAASGTVQGMRLFRAADEDLLATKHTSRNQVGRGRSLDGG